MRQLESAQGAGIEQGPVGKQKQGTKKNSIEGQGNRGRVVEGKGEVEGEKESGADDTYTRCKLYYSIGWLSAELAAKSLLESDQRHLGVSLNQLSFALLRAAERLDRPTAEAMLTVRHKIEFFATKMTASFVSETESVSIPVDAKAGAEKSAEEGTTSGLALTRVAAAAVTYRETRLLSAIATADSRGREQLMHFWSSVVTANPSLMGYSTALFELLDSHMAAGNGTGAIAWAKVSLKGGMLPPMRVKELLIRYSVTTSLHCLPALLPLLSKLSTSQSDLEFEDGLTSYDTPVLYRRGGGSDLFLPLPMSVLRTLSVTLLEQHRLGDARVLLKCVHPFQWPYDELLLALATASSIAGTNIDNVGEKGSEGRKRECTAVLRKREELSLSLSLNPISSSTAKALLAMHTDAGTPERKGDKAEKVAEDSDSEQTFRIMVARAVKSGGKDGPSRTASASAVLGGDNNNGRSLSSISSNALSEDDVRSGLLALLTLYSLTDSGSTSSVAQEVTADSASAVGVADASPVDDGGMSSGLEGNIAPPPPTSKWVDPESPENLAKFLSDVQNLGARSTQSSSTGSTRASSRGMLSKPSTTVGWREEGVEGGVVDRDRAESRSSSVGLRVSGSKKSWKRASAFGSSFDKTARSTTSLYSPSLDLSAATSPALTAQSAAAAADFDSAAAGAGEGVDEIVCRELARSLLSAVTSQISALERLTVHEEGEAEEGDIQQRSADGAAASRLGGQSEWQRGKQRRVVRAAEEKQYQSIEGAVAELFSLSNQQQADRLFRTFRDTPALCARLLHLCALRRDPGAAAVVLSQMAYQRTLSETLTQDPEMWQVCFLSDSSAPYHIESGRKRRFFCLFFASSFLPSIPFSFFSFPTSNDVLLPLLPAFLLQTIRSIMVNSTRTGKRSDEDRDRDRDRHTDRSQHQSLSSLEVWVDVKKMFSAVR